MNRSRTVVWRGALPLWLVLVAGLPLAALFLFSLAIAGAFVIGGALLASLFLPRLGNRRRPRADDGTIELDASQYRRLPDSRERR
jgi:hypothetical protein